MKSYSTFIELSWLSSKCHFLKSDLKYAMFNNLGLKKVVSEYKIILSCWFLPKKLIFYTFNQVFKTISLIDHLQGFLNFEKLLCFKNWYGAFQKSQLVVDRNLSFGNSFGRNYRYRPSFGFGRNQKSFGRNFLALQHCFWNNFPLQRTKIPFQISWLFV